jgi:hypothetical protein
VHWGAIRDDWGPSAQAAIVGTVVASGPVVAY